MSSFKPFVACEASAGSGKTWQLSLRYLALLLQGARAEEILCLTFTNKAANEMLERIGDLFDQIATDQTALNALCEMLGLGADQVLQKAQEAKARFLQSNHKIKTIDAFFNQILKQFALYKGFSPLFEIANIDQESKIEKFLEFVAKAGADEKLLHLCKLQHRSVEAFFDELNRIYTLKVDTKNFIKSHDQKEKQSARAEVFAHFETIRSFVLNSQSASPSAKKSVDLDRIDQILKSTWLEKSSLSEFNFFKKFYEPHIDNDFFALKNALKNYLAIEKDEILSTLFELYDLFVASQISLRKELKIVEFGDVTHLVYELLSGEIDRDFFYFKIDGEIEHLLIDEFQDTASVQFEILAPIIEEFTAGIGASKEAKIKSFFYVGDIKQSIYSFRGGNSYLFAEVQNRYKNIESVTLDTNYRSYKNIVEFVNRTFADRYESFAEQKSSKLENGAVSVKLVESPLDQVLEALDQLISKNIPLEKIAILTFTNSDSDQIVELIRSSRKYSVATETTSLLINQAEILAVVEIVKWLYFDNIFYKNSAENLLNIVLPDELMSLKVMLEKPPFDLVLEIAKRLNLLESGSILYSFLEQIASLRRVEELIFEIEKIDTKVQNSTQNAISILTIHKSKGLEFDHLIVADQLGRGRSGSDRIVFDFDGSHLAGFEWRVSGKEKVDTNYRNLLEKEKRESQKEEINLLYVALTRAKKSLTVLMKEKSSRFDLIGLSETKIGEIEAGERVAKQPPKTTAQRLITADFGRQNVTTKTKEKISGSYDQVLYGLALHLSLESLGGFDDSTCHAIAVAQNRYANVDFDSIKRSIEALIRLPQFQALISGTKPVAEMPIVYNGEVLRADLLLFADDEIVVVDYKSGKPNEIHNNQVAKYMNIVEKLSGKKTKGVLVYLGDTPSLVEVKSAKV